jgi:hypothetical protein
MLASSARFALLSCILAASISCAGAVTQDPPEGPGPGADASVEPNPDAGLDASSVDAGVIGQACVADEDCGDGYRCQTTVPGGYCLTYCDQQGPPCPDGTLCSPLPLSRVSGVCMLSCTSSTDCRAGYVCAVVELFPGDPNSPKSPGPVCWEPPP